MRRTNLKISPVLREMTDDPNLIEDDGTTEVARWNQLVEQWSNLDPIDQSELEPKLRIQAGRILYQGNDPKAVPLDDMLYLLRQSPLAENYGLADQQFRSRVVDRVRGPLTAIRSYCIVFCMNGDTVAVRTCEDTTCPFWPFRMGSNPFFGKIADAEAVSVDEPEETEVADAS